MSFIRCLSHRFLLMMLGAIPSKMLIRSLFLLTSCMIIQMKSPVKFMKRILGLRIAVYSNNGHIGHCRMFIFRIGQIHLFLRGWNNLRLIASY